MVRWDDVVQRVLTLCEMSRFEARDETRNLRSGRDYTSNLSDPPLVFFVHKGHMVHVLYRLQVNKSMDNYLNEGPILKEIPV